MFLPKSSENSRPRYLTALAILVLMALITAACSGSKPARRETRVESGEEASEGGGLGPGEEGGEVVSTEGGPGTSGASGGGGRVIGTTDSGVTITETGTGLPRANIWPADQDRVGFGSTIKLCMHAPFLLGPIFNNHPDDEDVYWDMVNDGGGIYGRKVSISFFDDGYSAGGTTEALNQCRQQNPFLYLGGVGFDQAPAARQWAETNKQPYFYNMAVEAGGLKYSFTPIPSIQMNGRILGQFAGSRFKGKKVGTIFVDSDNWRAGMQEFDKALKAKGMQIDPNHRYPIANNNYPDFGLFISQMQLDGVDVVLTYINALALARFLVQADDQGFHPVVLSPDGFDLVTDTAGNGPTGDGIDHMRNFAGIYAAWVSPAYEFAPPSSKARSSVSWYSEMQAMRNAYAKYRPSKVPNDVDWMFWLYFKTLHRMFLDCTKDCSRNVLAGMMLTGYRTQILGCEINFAAGKGRIGGHHHNIYQSKPSGSRSFWRQIDTCKNSF